MTRKKNIFLIITGGFFILAATMAIFWAWGLKKEKIEQYLYFGLPTEIRDKHAATIDQADKWLIEHEGEKYEISRAKPLNLDVYIVNLQLGVLPYVREDKQFKQGLENLIHDLQYLSHNKGRVNSLFNFLFL